MRSLFWENNCANVVWTRERIYMTQARYLTHFASCSPNRPMCRLSGCISKCSIMNTHPSPLGPANTWHSFKSIVYCTVAIGYLHWFRYSHYSRLEHPFQTNVLSIIHYFGLLDLQLKQFTALYHSQWLPFGHCCASQTLFLNLFHNSGHHWCSLLRPCLAKQLGKKPALSAVTPPWHNSTCWWAWLKFAPPSSIMLMILFSHSMNERSLDAHHAVIVYVVFLIFFSQWMQPLL